MTTYTGWHFLADPAQLANGGGPVPSVGESVSIDGEPILCEAAGDAARTAEHGRQERELAALFRRATRKA